MGGFLYPIISRGTFDIELTKSLPASVWKALSISMNCLVSGIETANEPVVTCRTTWRVKLIRPHIRSRAEIGARLKVQNNLALPLKPRGASVNGGATLP